MANAEWKDDGRRCHACCGPRVNMTCRVAGSGGKVTEMGGWLIQYRIIGPNGTEFIANFHPTCVGSWLMSHIDWRIEFEQGPVLVTA